ncbi:hypothetical protein NBRC116601_13940 [Cognatishimia sp. WU-CL00825]
MIWVGREFAQPEAVIVPKQRRDTHKGLVLFNAEMQRVLVSGHLTECNWVIGPKNGLSQGQNIGRAKL